MTSAAWLAGVKEDTGMGSIKKGDCPCDKPTEEEETEE